MRFYQHKTDGSSVFAFVAPNMYYYYAHTDEQCEVSTEYLAECREITRGDVPYRLIKALRLKGYTI